MRRVVTLQERRVPSSSNVSTKTASSEGTKKSVATWYARLSSSRYNGSLCPPGFAITSVPPTSNGQNTSHSETPKPYAAFWMTASPTASWKVLCSQPTRWHSASCATITPLGRPVVPDV